MTPADLVLTGRGVRFLGRHLPYVVGRGGVTAHKREGDGATPAGIRRIIGCLYRPDRMARPNPWAIPIRPGDLWSDAPEDVHYNTSVRAPYPHSHEALRPADRLYDLVLLTDWNWPVAVAHMGSAIFIHRWRRPGYPTEGCIALAPQDLRWIARHVVPGSRVIVT